MLSSGISVANKAGRPEEVEMPNSAIKQISEYNVQRNSSSTAHKKFSSLNALQARAS